MVNFKFRLESVLGVRRSIEEQRKRELAKLKEFLRKEQDFLEELEQARKNIQIRMRDSQKDILNMEEVLNYSNYLAAFRKKLIEQISLIQDLIKGVDEKRQSLISASKERKIIEKLKDNRYREFKEMVDRWETVVLDELATNGYTHRSDHARNPA